MNWAVLPLKDFVDAKQRLSPVLEPHERRALVRAMLEDVMTVLTQSAQIQRVLIVSDEPEADAIAQRYGATVLKPQRPGLNPAVQEAAEFVRAHKGKQMLVIHADLPLVTSEDIDQVFSQHRSGSITVVSDGANQGTNVLLCSLAHPFNFYYGENSRQLHQQEAQQQGIEFDLHRVDNMHIDVDCPADLLQLIKKFDENTHQARLTRQYLKQSGVLTRLHRIGGLAREDAIEKMTEITPEVTSELAVPAMVKSGGSSL